jgi:hypothetical protein
MSQSLEEMIQRRREFLTAYQDAGYARRYTDFVQKVRDAEAARVPGSTQLTSMVARYLFKLMAYKDEYEVARLYTGTDFLKRVAAQFEGDYRLSLHLAPPLWAKNDPVTGEPRKRLFGPWMLGAMRVLAKLKGLRGTAFDVFGYSAERRTERRADRRVPHRGGGPAGWPRAEADRVGRRDRLDPRVHPRIWPGEGAPPEGREGARGGAAGAVGRSRSHGAGPHSHPRCA